MRVAYLDPPYPGMSSFYKDHKDYAGEVDHSALGARAASEFDGWILHTASTTLPLVLPCFRDYRIGSWIKPFCAFKRNVPVAYAWEPVLFKPCRKQVVGRTIRPLRDFISCPMTMKRGLVGAKPEAVCWWAFELVGLRPEDELVDVFPGSGAVTRAWDSWRVAVHRLGLFGERVRRAKSS